MLIEENNQFDTIKLVWRPGPHSAREVVGTLIRTSSTFQFHYDGEDLSRAVGLGFRGYPGMNDLDHSYNGQSISAFASRIPSRERSDFDHLVGAWGANRDMDDFTMLGVTGGRLPTDMFEFIPVIHAVPGTSFLTDLAGIQIYAGSEAFRTLKEGAALELVRNPENEFDRFAVEVRHEGLQVASIKRVHSEAVSLAISNGMAVACTLVRVRMNGIIREVVVRITFS
jgi:hypothetical protein